MVRNQDTKYYKIGTKEKVEMTTTLMLYLMVNIN